jgi:tRNA-specific 2-thiouridylase
LKLDEALAGLKAAASQNMNAGTNNLSTIAVAMSGGVDSSTAAALLRAQGHAVVGLTMQLWNQRRLAELRGDGAGAQRCCSVDDVYDARRVAEHLDVPFYVVNFEQRFEDAVVRPFVEDYLRGRTPVPCSRCNTDVKFDELLRMARQIGAGKLATGHYARVRCNEASGRYELLRARDSGKDQTYFLWGLTQEQLARTIFPLGEMSKSEVRDAARRAALPVSEKPESQEICFVPAGGYEKFIAAYRAEQNAPAEEAAGEIVTTTGEVIGEHRGIARFTVGQRRGLGVATGQPLYVIELDPARNRVVVGEDRELRRTDCLVEEVNWVSIARPERPVEAQVKIRHKHEPAAARVAPLDDGTARVTFREPQRAITPGQAAVFYSGDVVLGGGWIRGATG